MGKRIKILFLGVLVSSASFSQVNWDLDYNSANFAFLVVDFNTYNFEGGYFAKFPYHPGYDREYIPLSVVYNSPIDYGNILFKYSATDDTIFAADIWWGGQGKITFPDSIEASDRFTYDSTQHVHPFSIFYLNYVGEVVDSVFRRKADSAWVSVKNLSILQKFDAPEGVFRVALYLYAPAVGLFRPEATKWIIFLYRGQIIVGVENEKEVLNNYMLFQNYPNPFNPTTKIKFFIPKSELVQIKVYNILGKEIKTLIKEYKQAGNYEVEFDASASGGLPSGVYFYRMISESYSETKKMIRLR